MSIKAMQHVWEHSQQTGTALLMLLAIADHADDDGVCWPSVKRLAQKARIGERQAKRVFAALVAAGELEIERGIGRGHTTHYTVKGVTSDTFTTPEKVTRKTPIKREKVTSTCIKGDIGSHAHVEPSLTTKEQTTSAFPATPSKPAAAHTPTPQQALFGAVCEACGWDYRTLPETEKQRVAQTCGILTKAEYTATDVQRFQNEVWSQSWFWKEKHSYPTLNQLRAEIGKVRDLTGATTTNPATPLSFVFGDLK